MKSTAFAVVGGAVLAVACATDDPVAAFGTLDGGGGQPSASGGRSSAGTGNSSTVGGATHGAGGASTGGAEASGGSTHGAGGASTGGSEASGGSTHGAGGSTHGAGGASTGGSEASDGSTHGTGGGSTGGSVTGDGSTGSDADPSGDGAHDGSVALCHADLFDGNYRECPQEWVRQFGGPNDDGARAVAVDGNGDIYVAGYVGGQLPGGPAISGGSFDAYVRKFGQSGIVIWTRQFGSSGDDTADSVAVDADGNVYVAGSAGAALPDQTAFGAWDAFVRKYDAGGTEIWTRQFGSTGYDTGRVAVDPSGNVIVSGLTERGLAGETDGGTDAGAIGYAFVRKYDGSGTALWTRQFGSAGAQVGGSANVFGSAAVDGSGNIYIAGFTDGSLPGQTSAGGQDVFVRKYDTGGSEMWTRQFGTSADDGASAASTDSDGNVYVAGRTFGALPNQSNAGKADAFVRKYDAGGTEVWTRQFGSTAADGATAVRVDGSSVYVGGNTNAALPNQTSAGGTDVFVRDYGTDGTELGTRQFGTPLIEQQISLSVAPNALYVSGQTNGAFRPNVGSFDAFLIRLGR
jgi:Beta-propeller repeat